MSKAGYLATFISVLRDQPAALRVKALS